MRLRRIALYSLGGAVAIVIAVAAWVWFADLGVLKPQIQRWVSEKTGREFVIDGHLHIDVGTTTVIVAERLQLQNADWASPAPMASIERIEAQVELASVFGDGPIVIRRIDLDGATLNLSQRDDGRANWTFAAASPSADTTSEPKKGVEIREVTVAQAELRFDSSVDQTPLAVSMTNADIRTENLSDRSAATSIDMDVDALTLVTAEPTGGNQAPAGAPRVIPDVALPVSALHGLNLKLTADIGDLTVDGLAARELATDIRIASGRLDVAQLEFLGATGSVVAVGHWDSGESPTQLYLDLVADGFDLGVGATDTGPGTQVDLVMSLSGTGDDLRSLAKTSNGAVFANATGGRFENNALADVFLSDALQQILAAINPMRESKPHTDVQCFVFAANVVDGVVENPAPSIVSTDTVLASLQSTINLDDEAIDVKVRTTPQAGITLSASEILNPYVEVGGTLAEPNLNVDEAGALLSGGAAVLTGGLSVLAKAALDRLSKSDSPCVDAAAENRAAVADQLPSLEAPAAAD